MLNCKSKLTNKIIIGVCLIGPNNRVVAWERFDGAVETNLLFINGGVDKFLCHSWLVT